MRRRLAHFSSLVDSYPSFVIPVFEQPGSNGACVQDLALDGRVKRFLPFATNDYHSVPATPDKVRVDIGDPGLMAVWIDQYSVICADREGIIRALSSLDLSALPAFFALEASALIGSKTAVRQAATRASKYLTVGSGQANLVERTLARVILQRAWLDADPDEDQVESLGSFLDRLQREASDEVWFRIWRTAADTYSRKPEITQIALWRLNGKGLGEFEEPLISDINARIRGSVFSAEFYLNWLSDRPFSQRGWSNVWALASASSSQSQELLALGVSYLRSYLDRETPSRLYWAWLVMWRRLWRTGFAAGDLLSIAESAQSCRFNTDHYVEAVLMPILETHADIPWVNDFLARWLESPRSLNTWVDAAITYGNDKNPKHREAIMEWLKYLGAGSNQWVRLWKYVGPTVPPADWTDLSIAWLNRARTDLSTWPVVFQTVADTLGGDRVKLQRAAARWMADKQPYRHNALIERTAAGA